MKLTGQDSGIYLILCDGSRRVYVGHSLNVGVRLRNHRMLILGESLNVFYGGIIEDMRVFGRDSVVFVRYLDLPGLSTSELIERECGVLLEFMGKGYGLYNRDLPVGVLRDYVCCPRYLRKIVGRLVDVLEVDDGFKGRVDLLIREFTDSSALGAKY